MKRILYILLAIIIFAAVAGVFMQKFWQPKAEDESVLQSLPSQQNVEISDICKHLAASEQESCSKAIKLVELSAANSTAYKAEKAENGSWVVYVESVTAAPTERIVTPTGDKVNPSDIEAGKVVRYSLLVESNGRIIPIR